VGTRLATALSIVLLCGPASIAAAHGFGQRYDLPVPLWLYVVGAAVAVAGSFLVIGLFVRDTPLRHPPPRFNLLHCALGRLLAHPVCLFMLQLLSVLLLVMLVLTGCLGNQHPMQNLAPTLVWVIWWVGVAYVSALLGNLWAVLNPWQALFAWTEVLYRRIKPGGVLAWRLPYPKAWGIWPGVMLFLAFAWVELIFDGAAVPVNLALLALGYTGLTWVGMWIFGPEVWLRYGEAFTLAFGLLARFAPTEVRVIQPEVCRTCSLDCQDQDGECINCYACFQRAAAHQREWNIRPFAAGLLRHETASISEMAFVLLVLATVTFDGIRATPLWVRCEHALAAFLPPVVTRTLGLAVLPVLFLGMYAIFCRIMVVASGIQRSTAIVARRFIYTLVPIALAYHIAHYLSFLLMQGQFIIPLLSDPFGFGWDLFGTASYRPNLGLVGARFAWFTAVTAIVVGHILAVYLAHRVALHTWRTQRSAVRSQYPMVALMLGYTMLSLWLLAQPIVEHGESAARMATASPAGDLEVPADAFVPEPDSGNLREVGPGRTAAMQIIYQVLTSAFHDGTHMTTADLLYPYIFAYRWSTPARAPVRMYDPYVARATATLRAGLVGLKVLRVERSEQGIGDFKLVRETPVIAVYMNTHVETQHAAVLAPPWSSLPWHLMVLMEEAVQRGWAAFSVEAAQHNGVKWLDLVRDPQLQGPMAELVEAWARQGYVPEPLQHFVTADEARQRWLALRTFAQTHGHFLVTNGPYRLSHWSDEAVVFQVFRDPSYPLGVGSYDHYALPHRAYITQITAREHGLEVQVDVERVERFQRTYDIVREPLRAAADAGKKGEIPLCRYVVLSPAGSVVGTGTATYAGKGLFRVELPQGLTSGLYTVLIAMYLNENYVNPEIRMVPFHVTR
jgi:hypothetical protein